jgi:hypothetical protein
MYGGGYAGDPRGRAEAVSDRQGRDDFSFEDRRADRSGYSGGYDKGPGAISKTSPEESFSAKPIAKPTPKPTGPKIEFYLDDSPAFVEQKKEAPVDSGLGGLQKHPETIELESQIDSFSAFTPTQSGTLTQAFTGMTPEGWNLHRKASESTEQNPNLTAAQKDAAKAKNIVTLGKMSPWAAAASAYPYQMLQEVFRNPISGWKTGGLAALANLKGVGSALAEEDYFGKENSITQGFKSGPLFNLGGNIANTQMGLMRMYDLLFGQGNSGGP